MEKYVKNINDVLNYELNTSHKNIKNRYIESKYKMPELIYWNLSKKESKEILNCQ